MGIEEIIKINIDISPNLLQEIRLIHSLCDEGTHIYCDYDEYLKLKPIKDFFNGNLHIGRVSDAVNISTLLKINHELPITEFKDDEKSLVFPKSLINYCYNDIINKNEEIYFRGKLTNSRNKSIQKLKQKINIKFICEISNKGRNFPIKTFDKDYFDTMKKYQFVFCPDGDFIWTYRFFESIMCGAIPIIENEDTIYKDFKYYKLDDDLSDLYWDEKWIKYNIKLLKERYTL